MAAAEEPIIPRLERLDNILRQLEDIRGGNRTPKSSYASTPSSGTITSDGNFFSPRSLEKHCRPIDDVIMETELKGPLIERLVGVEDRVLKMWLHIDEELETEKRSQEGNLTPTPEKKSKKGFKSLVKSCVKGKRKNH